MKHISRLLAVLTVVVLACNNEGKDSVEKADSANEAKQDAALANPRAITTDEESTAFLVKAAAHGMAEVQMGELAQQKALSPQVKNFGAMMKKDHGATNETIAVLASQRNVTLPSAAGDIHKKDINDLNKKTGIDFDKAYMKTMIRAHNEGIDFFEQAAANVNDAAIKIFIDNTLPRLRNHLDSAKAIQKTIR